MAEVLVTFKIMPEDADTNMDGIVKKIKELKDVRLNNIEREPIAFGLVALKPSFIAADAEGVADKIEDALKKIEGVGGAEVIEVTRLL
jgi:elongation factor 1-beta